jgi:hypothetical protein
MTKLELIAALESKFISVEAAQDVSNETELAAGFHRFICGVWLSSGVNGIVRQNISFYVEAPGGDTDTAYWQGSEPQPTIPTSFSTEVETYIAAKIAEGVIEGAFVEALDPVNETAQATAWVDNAGTLEHRTVLLDRDGVGDIRHRVLGGSS